MRADISTIFVHTIVCNGSTGQIGWTLCFLVTNPAAWWLLYSVVFYFIIRQWESVDICQQIYIHMQALLFTKLFQESNSTVPCQFSYSCVRHQYRSGSDPFEVRSGNKSVLKYLKIFLHAAYNVQEFHGPSSYTDFNPNQYHQKTKSSGKNGEILKMGINNLSLIN